MAGRNPLHVALVDTGATDTVAADLTAAEEITVEQTTDPTGYLTANPDATDGVVVPLSRPSADTLLELNQLRTQFPTVPILVTVDDDTVPIPNRQTDAFALLSTEGDDLPAQIETTLRSMDHGRDRYDEPFQAMVEHSPALISVLDAQGRYEYVSPSVATILGYDPDELRGENAFEKVHPDDRTAVFETFTASVTDPTRRPDAEYRYEDATGEYRHIHSWGKNRLDDPAVNGFVVISLDVTEQKSYEAELERHRQMVDAVDDGVYALDENLRVETFNQTALELTGYTADEADGKHISAFLGAETTQRLADIRDSLINDQATTTVELPIKRKDGTTFPAEVSLSLLEPEADAFRGAAGVVRDISERERQQRELERKTERLAQFADMVAHDLQNPLSIANGYLTMARETHDDDDHLDRVATALDRMDDLTTDLLTLAHDGRHSMTIQPVEFGETISECWHTVDTNTATLAVDGGGTIRADKSRLKQLLENLIRNAVEHGGDQITIGTTPEGFYVEDNGPGIPTDHRTQIFEHGVSFATDGTGFGLSIVDQIVTDHDWSIHVTDGDDGGARFDITDVEFVST